MSPRVGVWAAELVDVGGIVSVIGFVAVLPQREGVATGEEVGVGDQLEAALVAVVGTVCVPALWVGVEVAGMVLDAVARREWVGVSAVWDVDGVLCVVLGDREVEAGCDNVMGCVVDGDRVGVAVRRAVAEGLGEDVVVIDMEVVSVDVWGVVALIGAVAEGVADGVEVRVRRAVTDVLN